ncbi:uncharacterized protein EURHEDRAFT_272334 [Aspergillus ruber CBS 135680]|uniref:Uncharacterized protein n=1 Tax=Aspergillus ruber (strain CBS 135680) TaxID=1388766 RepID=A0A017SN06_ASPRC|nr:uncharacterized protein EURHEDRAFT_272334 [Aspergillus ruber CBS 135680]EYE98176.1 hypothetical protein EURHEDRAFT_272334 [Aspergillus ruber CBS 135680]
MHLTHGTARIEQPLLLWILLHLVEMVTYFIKMAQSLQEHYNNRTLSSAYVVAS